MRQDSTPLQLEEDRFTRLRSIEWWDQAKVSGAKVLVVGAGALGNEVVKNLALLGVGALVVVDFDLVEKSNLSRSVLLREHDEGKPKASCVCKAAGELFPGLFAIPVVGNVMAEIGLGVFRWADVVVGAVDNREARVWVNSACARAGRPWVDGGIEALRGVVRGFAPPQTACYECTMNAVDWELLNRRRSCSLLARRAAEAGGTPTTSTSASVIGALQVQEVIKLIHGLPALLGRGWVFDGVEHNSYVTNYPINPDCPWHEAAPAIEKCPSFDSHVPLLWAWQRAEALLGGCDALDFGRELVSTLTCSGCGNVRNLSILAETLNESHLTCLTCHVECAPDFIHSLEKNSSLLERTAADLALPLWDVLWARRGLDVVGIELTGDAAAFLARAQEDPK